MPLVILDRDGVINYDSDDYIKSVEEFKPIPGSLEAMVRLCKAGVQVAVVTNQSGIARGYYDLDTLHQMHAKLSTLLHTMGGKIDHIYFCPHGPNDHCLCRKPLPGMLEQAMQASDAKATETTMIGDSISDLAAAEAAGVPVMLVRTGKGERSLAQIQQQQIYTHVPVYQNLQAAVSTLLGTLS